MEELLGMEPDRGVEQRANPNAGDISERASVAIVESIFKVAIHAWVEDETPAGVTTACDTLQLFDMDTLRMLSEPHQTAAMRAFAQCTMWNTGRLLGDGRDNAETETMIVVPVTVWICEHGPDDLRGAVRVCSSPESVAALKTTWENVMEVGYDETISN